jgi:hypothetical protein
MSTWTLYKGPRDNDRREIISDTYALNRRDAAISIQNISRTFWRQESTIVSWPCDCLKSRDRANQSQYIYNPTYFACKKAESSVGSRDNNTKIVVRDTYVLQNQEITEPVYGAYIAGTKAEASVGPRGKGHSKITSDTYVLQHQSAREYSIFRAQECRIVS